MTEDEVIQTVRQNLERQFPKVCPNCNRRFDSLREYILATKRIGFPKSYDADLEEWNPKQPIGAMALANCSCGSTLALTTDNMTLSLQLALLEWVRIETRRLGISASELLDRVRDKVRELALDEPDK